MHTGDRLPETGYRSWLAVEFARAGRPSLTRKLWIAYSVAMNPSDKCPFCASTRVVCGKLVAEDYGAYFEPAQISVPGWRKATGIGTTVPTKPQAAACLQCGKIWGELDPTELETLLSKYGADELKAHLGDKRAG